MKQTKKLIKEALEASVSDKGNPPCFFSFEPLDPHPIICSSTLRENHQKYLKPSPELLDLEESVKRLVEVSLEEREVYEEVQMKLSEETVSRFARFDEEIEMVSEKIRAVFNSIHEQVQSILDSLFKPFLDCIFDSDFVMSIKEMKKALETLRPIDLELKDMEKSGVKSQKAISEVLKKHLNGQVQTTFCKMSQRISDLERLNSKFDTNPFPRLDLLMLKSVSITQPIIKKLETDLSTFIENKKKMIMSPERSACGIIDGVGFCKGTNRGCNGGGTVWGSNPYTRDSFACGAAVHAGLITRAQGGYFRVGVEEDHEEYTGTEANGISSQSWGPFAGAFYAAY